MNALQISESFAWLFLDIFLPYCRMSSTDNTKVIGLAWPDDRQGSICSLTPLVLSTSATSSVADLDSQRALIASEVEVHLGNPSTSTTSATETSSGKGPGLFKKNLNTKQVTDNYRHKGSSEMMPNGSDRMPFNVLEVHHQTTMLEDLWWGLGPTLHCTKWFLASYILWIWHAKPSLQQVAGNLLWQVKNFFSKSYGKRFCVSRCWFINNIQIWISICFIQCHILFSEQ